MEFTAAVIAGLLTPIVDLAANEKAKIYWLYLFSGLVIAALVYLRLSPDRSLRGFARYLFPKAVYANGSTWADYKLYFTNSALVLPVFAGMGLMIGMAASDAAARALAALFGAGGPGLTIDWTARSVFTVAELLAIDGGLFLAHYLQHRVPLLWEFHKTHHSAETLTPITVFRMHPVDLFLNTVLVVLAAGAVAGAFRYLYAAPVASFAVHGMNIGLFAFYVAGMHLRHSHVWLMYPGWFGRHISSPALHQIHHSMDPRHYDRNMAQIFTFWDRLTGTLYIPDHEEKIAYGLSGGEHERFRSYAALYLRPVAAAFDLLRGGPSRRASSSGA